MNARFTPAQRRLLIVCVAVYTTAYFCRLNLSAALESMMQDLSLSMARGGLLQTVFAAVYAAGQFINGSLVDRLNPARHMLAGLLGSAACNLLMGLVSSYPLLLLLWAANAAFQSMLWTPIMRLVAIHFSTDAARERASAALALTLIVGHLGAWAISGFLAGCLSWRWSFIAPSLIALAMVLLVHPALRGADEQDAPAKNAATPKRAPGAAGVFASTGFFLVLATCVLYGFIRDGVVTWAPTILSRMNDGAALSSAAFSLLLPAINFIGVLLGFALRRRGAPAHQVVCVMMLAAMLCALPLTAADGMLLTALLLGLVCAGMYGANAMLTGLIPLEYDRIGRTGMTAGLIDSFIYAGSSLAGVLGGALYERMGENALYLSFFAAAAVSALLMHAAGRMSARYWRSE